MKKSKKKFALLGIVWKANPKYVLLSLLGVLSNIPTRVLNVYTLSHMVIYATEGAINKIFTLSCLYIIYMLIITVVKHRFEEYKQVSEETIRPANKSQGK